MKQFQLELDRNNHEGFASLQFTSGWLVAILGIIAITSALAVKRIARRTPNARLTANE